MPFTIRGHPLTPNENMAPKASPAPPNHFKTDQNGQNGE